MKRKDGKLVKNIDSTHKIMPFLMSNRTEAEVYMTETFDITKLMEFIEEKNKVNENKITLFHAVIAAFSKTIYNRPLLNRFVAGKRFYDRYDISFGFIAKPKPAACGNKKLQRGITKCFLKLSKSTKQKSQADLLLLK